MHRVHQFVRVDVFAEAFHSALAAVLLGDERRAGECDARRVGKCLEAIILETAVDRYKA
jgi:hypothetical protein